MRELSCEEVVERLPALVVGDLSDTELLEMDAHGVNCLECALDIRQSRTLSRTLDLLSTTVRHDERVASDLPQLKERLIAALPKRAAYDRIDSPLGPVYLVVSNDGLCAIHYGGDEQEIIAWGRSAGLEPLPDPTPVQPFIDQLREYLAGERREFDLPVDLSTVSPFTQSVLEATARVPYGHLVSYRDIAKAIDKPGATRAVGNALGSNPVPIVVPCHRVVRSDGSLGGYTGGLHIKRHLLEIEGVLLGM